MTINTIACQITTSSTPVNLNDRTTYRVLALGWGRRTWRHVTQENDFFDGQIVIASLRNPAARILGLRVLGSSAANLLANLAALDVLFSQRLYTVSGSLNGAAFSWDGCIPADLEPGEGGMIQKFHLATFRQDVLLNVQSDPSATTGPF